MQLIYVICPNCGNKLLKAADGSVLEVKCPKCRYSWAAEVREGEIKIKKIKDIDEQE